MNERSREDEVKPGPLDMFLTAARSAGGAQMVVENLDAVRRRDEPEIRVALVPLCSGVDDQHVLRDLGVPEAQRILGKLAGGSRGVFTDFTLQLAGGSQELLLVFPARAPEDGTDGVRYGPGFHLR